MKSNELLIFETVHHVLQFLRYRKPHSCCVLDDRDPLIRDVEEDHGRAQDAAASNDVGIEDIRHTHKSKDADLLADSLEANGTRQFLLDNRTQNTRDVVRCDECDKCIEQIVEAAEELPDHDANARKKITSSHFLVAAHATKIFSWSPKRHDTPPSSTGGGEKNLIEKGCGLLC